MVSKALRACEHGLFLTSASKSVEQCQERMAAVPASVFVSVELFLLKHVSTSVFYPIND